MSRLFFLPVMMLAFLITSCQKEEPVKQDFNNTEAIFKRINQSSNPTDEIRKINEEAGRYVDDEGNVYFSEGDYNQFVKNRDNPSSRSSTIYNEIENSTVGMSTVVWINNNGNYEYLATIGGNTPSSVFVNFPNNYSNCNSYLEYYAQSGRQGNSSGCYSNCCGLVIGRFIENVSTKDEDYWKPAFTIQGVGDPYKFRIRNSLYTGPCCFANRQYVIDKDCNNQVFLGGPDCGYSDTTP